MGKRKRYQSVIYLNDEATHVVANGESIALGGSIPNKYRGYYVTHETATEHGSYEWENEMINAALDGFKGTDWSKVVDIEY